MGFIVGKINTGVRIFGFSMADIFSPMLRDQCFLENKKPGHLTTFWKGEGQKREFQTLPQ